MYATSVFFGQNSKRLLHSLFSGKKFVPIWMSTRVLIGFVRVFVLVVCTCALKRITNPSAIYHWIRSQSLFKLYMIKAVNEVLDRMLKGYGHLMMDNFARVMLRSLTLKMNKVEFARCLLDKIVATVGVIIYSVVHSFILSMEMFTIHVVTTSSSVENIYSFLFYNNFSEIKMFVFKKQSQAGLYEMASYDAVERTQIIIYLINICFTTMQDRQKIVKFCTYVMIAEVITDSIKHFFMCRVSELDSQIYYYFTSQTLKNF